MCLTCWRLLLTVFVLMVDAVVGDPRLRRAFVDELVAPWRTGDVWDAYWVS